MDLLYGYVIKRDHVHACECLPCISSNAGLLVSLDNGDKLITMHVMLVALSVEVTIILRVDLRMPFCSSRTIAVPAPIFCPLASQAKPFAIAVQLNSATSVSDMFTDCGGIMISSVGSAKCCTPTNLIYTYLHFVLILMPLNSA